MTWLSTTTWFIQSPWMLFALFSLLVPIAIHLLSKSKGKLVPTGNIKFIQLSKPVRMNELRLVKPLLLLCRLMLLFFTVMLLAQVYFNENAANTSNSEGHILVTQDWLNHADEAELDQIALKAKNGIVMLLSTQGQQLANKLTSDAISTWKENEKSDVAKLNQQNSSQQITGQQNTFQQRTSEQNTWMMVKNAIETLPKNTKVTVYSTNRLSQFTGDKVSLPENVSWQIKQHSLNDITKAIELLRTQSLSILVVSDDAHDKEKEYLQAALSVIKKNTLQNLSFSFDNTLRAVQPNTVQPNTVQSNTIQANTIQANKEQAKKDQLRSIQLQIKQQHDWILYLSSQPVSDSILNEIKAGTKFITDSKHLDNKDVSHFIEWDEEITSVAFPQLLVSLLLEESIKTYQNQQPLTNEQIQSVLIQKKKTNAHSLSSQSLVEHPLFNNILILLIVFFWLVERFLSEIDDAE